MTFTISISDLAIGVLIILAIVLAVYIIITLSKVNRTLNNINALLDANRKNIDDSVKSLPEICDNVKGITKSVRDKTDLVDQYVTRNDEAAAGLDIQSVVAGVTTLIELFGDVKDYFTNKRSRR